MRVPGKENDRSDQSAPDLTLNPVDILASFRYVQAQKRFALLEDELDLPANPVEASHSGAGQFVSGSVGDEDEPTGQFEGSGGRLPPFLFHRLAQGGSMPIGSLFLEAIGYHAHHQSLGW